MRPYMLHAVYSAYMECIWTAVGKHTCTLALQRVCVCVCVRACVYVCVRARIRVHPEIRLLAMRAFTQIYSHMFVNKCS